MMVRRLGCLVMFAALATLSVGAQATTPRDVDDLVDMRASSGERELENRGYDHRKTIKVGDSSISYWWKGRGEHCIAVTTKDGRYTAIADQPDAVCGDDRASGAEHHGGDKGGLDDLVGMRASSGERELEGRGFAHRKTTKVNNGSIAYWWKQRAHRCIAVTTRDGRYKSVMDQPSSMCDGGASGSGGHDGVGREAPPGGFHVPGDDAPPEVIVGKNGEGEVTFGSSRCVVYYDARGRRKNSLPACTHDQVEHADRAMAGHRREQGL